MAFSQIKHKMTDKDKKQLEHEIRHIFESGENELRIFNMAVDFIEKREANLEQTKSKLLVAVKALQDVKKWDDDLEDEWGDPGERAGRALEKIDMIDGF
jgi:hypothetical protein